MTGPQGKKICVKDFFCSASSSNKNACFLEIKTHIFTHLDMVTQLYLSLSWKMGHQYINRIRKEI